MAVNEWKQKAKELVSKMTIAERMEQLRYDAPAIERLGVPAYNWWNECLHGVARQGRATVFPQAIAMAASFDSELLGEIGVVISEEARAKYNQFRQFGYTEIYQGLTFWSPNINIFRDPRWGRGHETYGEDPYLTGRMASAFINGLQGSGKYRKCDATIKHFAVHSGPEKDRHGFNAEVCKKDLYETYLSAFRYCIEHAHPAAVMGAYNRVNGEACCGSKTLLKDILCDELGFDGYVVSDCGAICDIHDGHHITENDIESAALAVNSGCHLNCGKAYRWLKDAYEQGLVSEETVTEACEKLFETRFRLGMFADDCEYDGIGFGCVESAEHRALSRKMADESIVLLKNDGILPLKNVKKIAVIGPNADSKAVLLANYNGTPSVYYTLLRGIQENTDAEVVYAYGCHLFNDPDGGWCEQPGNEAVAAAKYADVVIMCMGLDSTLEGEEGDAYNADMSGDRADLLLPAVQRRLTEKIVALGKPVVFVNVSGSCIDLSYENENCSALVQCFYPGAEGGNALADVLFGKVSPSGKLPVTFYASSGDLPDFKDYSMKNRTYRYFTGKPLFPFGYGLSYSSFAYSDIRIENGKVLADVENTGGVDADEVVQLYADSAGHENQPLFRLIGFERISLKKGEKKTVGFTLTAEMLSLYDMNGKRKVFDGDYTVWVGGCLPSDGTLSAAVTVSDGKIR